MLSLDFDCLEMFCYGVNEQISSFCFIRRIYCWVRRMRSLEGCVRMGEVG